MPRPTMERILGSAILKRGFKPSGGSAGKTEEVVLTFDEAEALRLADLEGLYQQAAAQRMGVSRPTFGRIIESARRKTADALINGKRILIDGGKVSVDEKKDRETMIAVPTTSRGLVEVHFGQCERFTVFTVDTEGAISDKEIIEASINPGCKSGATARLAAMGVSVLLAGCIGEGAVHAFGAHGMQVVRGASGPARAVALAYARGELVDSGESCDGGCRSPGHRCPE
jgi:predicted DNA-binding protein (UPF0251 family)/predicted Fe-Mo cluster-binding NifX family protein